MRAHAERYYRTEMAVSREITLMKEVRRVRTFCAFPLQCFGPDFSRMRKSILFRTNSRWKLEAIQK